MELVTPSPYIMLYFLVMCSFFAAGIFLFKSKKHKFVSLYLLLTCVGVFLTKLTLMLSALSEGQQGAMADPIFLNAMVFCFTLFTTFFLYKAGKTLWAK